MSQADFIEYTQIEGAPGLYFQCGPMGAKLSVSACAESHRLSRQLESIQCGRRFHCKNCQIGKIHAGEAASDVVSRIFGRVVCSRCRRSRPRLVLHGICVSCFNRQQELKKGRNARGTPPLMVKPLWQLSIAVMDKAKEVRIKHLANAADYQESVLSELLKNDQACFFGRTISPYQSLVPALHGAAAGSAG